MSPVTFHAAGVLAWTTLSTSNFASETILDLAVSPAYATDKTLFVLTFKTGTNLWRTQDGAQSWQKVFTGSGSQILDYVGLSPDYGKSARVVYLLSSGDSGTMIWYSADAGSNWVVRPAPEGTGAPNPFIVASDSSLFLSGFDALNNRAFIRYSADGGLTYAVRTLTGNVPVYSMLLSPVYIQDRTILLGNTDGGVWWSENGGTSFLPVTGTGLTGSISVAFALSFNTSRIIIAASSSADGGIYRTSAGANQPWQRLDAAVSCGGMLGGLVTSSSGALYVSSFRRVITATSQGGLVRYLDPIAPFLCERVINGLNDGVVLLEGVLECVGNQLWTVDSAANRLLTFEDNLSQPVKLFTPANNALGVGNASTNSVSGVLLNWQPSEGALLYQWQLSVGSDFSVIPNGFTGTSSGTGVNAPFLVPSSMYFWRVRVAAPFYSPWSAVWSFTTPSRPVVLGVPLLVSPLTANIELKPMFYWNAVPGAGSYELVVSKASSYSNPVIAKTGISGLVGNSWQSDIDLIYDTKYYWRVRAMALTSTGAWSSAGIFITQTPVNTDTVLPASTISNTVLLTTVALPSSNPPTSASKPPVASTTSALITSFSMTPPGLPPAPVPVIVETVTITISEPPLTMVTLPITDELLIVPQIPAETPDWVYYFLVGGGAGVVLLSAIIVAARSRNKRLL